MSEQPWPPGHTPVGYDWICSCGYDFFGGSAAYSWALFAAHVGLKPSGAKA